MLRGNLAYSRHLLSSGLDATLRLAVDSIDRIEIDAVVPRGMTPVEEVEARRRVPREGPIVPQPLLEFALQLGVFLEHLRAYVLGDVRLHVLLALEGGVEKAPAHERVRIPRFEQRHEEMRSRLSDRHKKRTRRDIAPLVRPFAFDGHHGATLECLRRNRRLCRAER